jgi:hypothetical protein
MLRCTNNQEPIRTGRGKYPIPIGIHFTYMRVAALADCKSYPYAEMGFANPHAVTSMGDRVSTNVTSDVTMEVDAGLSIVAIVATTNVVTTTVIAC